MHQKLLFSRHRWALFRKNDPLFRGYPIDYNQGDYVCSGILRIQQFCKQINVTINWMVPDVQELTLIERFTLCNILQDVCKVIWWLFFAKIPHTIFFRLYHIELCVCVIFCFQMTNKYFHLCSCFYITERHIITSLIFHNICRCVGSINLNFP